MAVTVEISKLPVLPAMVSSTVYRVAAEGLANAHRYAGTGDVLLVVSLVQDGALEVTVGSRRPGSADPAAVRRWSRHRRTPGTGDGPRRTVDGGPDRRPVAPSGHHPRRHRPGRSMIGPSRISVVVVDDEPLVREGLKIIISGEPDLDVVGEAGDGAEAVSLVRRLRPDVVCMDVRMPGIDGIRATQLLVAMRRCAEGAGDDDVRVGRLRVRRVARPGPPDSCSSGRRRTSWWRPSAPSPPGTTCCSRPRSASWRSGDARAAPYQGSR